MRLATWNCQTGLDSNWGAVEALDADVLVVQECGSRTPAQRPTTTGGRASGEQEAGTKGLAVLARSPYMIETLEPSEPFVVSTLISGPERFRFVVFWAMDPKFAHDEYPQQATRVDGRGR